MRTIKHFKYLHVIAFDSVVTAAFSAVIVVVGILNILIDRYADGATSLFHFSSPNVNSTWSSDY